MRCSEMKKLLFALVLLLTPLSAEAATCFWVGGTATWSTANAASWSSSSGGTASTCAATGGVPKQAADTATFDGSSGGGTVTVDATINGVTLTAITSSAFTGTIDFSVNNPSITISSSWTDSGSGTHTLKLGSGTFTMSAVNGSPWNFAAGSLTLNAGTSTILFPGNVANNVVTFVAGNGLTYATVTFAASTVGALAIQLNGSSTITTLNIAAPNTLLLLSNLTITNALNITGTSFNHVVVLTSLSSTQNITLTGGGTFQWTAIGNLHFSGGTVTATNSFDMTGNTGITITGPSGGGGHIIGG
jgi:hypothetical protein